MKKLTITLSDEDHQALQEAAELAGRKPEEFFAEEMLDLARRIQLRGSTAGISLAGDRAKQRRSLIEQVRKGGDADHAVADWAAGRPLGGGNAGQIPQLPLMSLPSGPRSLVDLRNRDGDRRTAPRRAIGDPRPTETRKPPR